MKARRNIKRKTNLEYALEYAGDGWPVHPIHWVEEGKCSCGNSCNSPGKHPLTVHGLKDASTNEKIITGWWFKWPKANIGILTRIFFAIDYDPDKATEETRQFVDKLPKTRQTQTGGGGNHFLFYSQGKYIQNREGFYPGLDVRGNNGYIVAPPSKHISGNKYAWLNDEAIVEYPEGLLEELLAPNKGQASRIEASTILEGVEEGERNGTLFRYACQLRNRVERGQIEESEMEGLVLYAASQCKPPFPEGEALGCLDSAWNYSERGFNAPTSIPPGFHCTDIGNGQRLVMVYGPILKHCYLWRSWLIWDGRRWAINQDDEIYRLAKNTVRLIYDEAKQCEDTDIRIAIGKHAAKSEAKERVNAMITMAESEPEIAVTPDIFDTDTWLFNCQNGTADLRTGDVRPHSKDDLMTKVAPVEYDPKAGCPQWTDFLKWAMKGDQELVYFLQRAVGYSLTGQTDEQCLFFLHGVGANGKSTFVNVVQVLAGPYAKQASPSTFLNKKYDSGSGASPDVARLKGARFVSTVEPDKAKSLAESFIKQATGQDIILARFMYQRDFEFEPEFKLWLVANHKPVVRGVDNAIWRRIKLIPFENVVHDIDTELPDKLKTELPGILNWALEGCLQWQQRGLDFPEKVKEATRQYRSEMDILGEFVEQYLIVDQKRLTPKSAIYETYTRWMVNDRDKTLGKRQLTTHLRERGFADAVIRNEPHWVGIGLLSGATITGSGGS